jgi:hypothetical protein
MLARLHNRLGTAGLIVAIVALVAAMAGGAYAAGGGLTGKQKKEVKKIAKQYAGKQGPQGPAGPQGSSGAKGDAGAAGQTGAVGPVGPAGPIGPAGPTGSAGSPWTAGGTLPKGATETGTWFSKGTRNAVSFNIPLAAPLSNTSVVIVSPNPTDPVPAECENTEHQGTASVVNPEADPGFFCIFANASGEAAALVGDPATGGEGTSVAGATILGNGQGTWAVTGS